MGFDGNILRKLDKKELINIHNNESDYILINKKTE